MTKFVFDDKTGQRFGRLVAKEYLGGSNWLCQCDCGNTKVVRSNALSSGRTTSCGCYNKDVHSVPKHDLVGKRLGRLTVLSYYGNEKWECRCDCGKVSHPKTYALISGSAKSCGCYHSDVVGSMSRKHGDSETPLYKVWSAMKARCSNEKLPIYEYYGGRGISVCDEWLQYEPFKEWALSNGYETGLTLDRVDVNGNYCPQNCRWATWSEQNKNKRPYRKPNLFKAVDMLEDGKVLRSFESIRDAAEYIGGNITSTRVQISKVIHGQRETAYGYEWRFANEIS